MMKTIKLLAMALAFLIVGALIAASIYLLREKGDG